MRSLFDLDGQTALVTGVTRGIGQAIAMGLAEAGADIVGVGRQLSSLQAFGQSVVHLGRRFWAQPCDLADRDAIYRLVRWLDTEGLTIDILVLNAGITRRAPAADFLDEDWDHLLSVNLSAPFVLAREIGRTMIRRQHGKMIFLASLLSFQGGRHNAGYAASKGGVVQLAKALANDWAQYEVQVNCLAPGYVTTELTQPLHGDPARRQEIVSRIPLGRWATPDDFKGPAVFLASKASDYVTGHVLVVDGGWLAY
ncbi:MAG: SDR family oxidoreductase [Firmicutes bacterium]|nr:SDR family oxidoreductase [Bacillota bacterium]